MPFILAHATTGPLSNVLQILSRPEHKEMNITKLADIFRPFIGFFLFLAGKLLILLYFLCSYEAYMPGLTSKPFTMCSFIGLQLTAPIGLHFFLAYQEYIIYSFCSFHRALANHIIQTSQEKDNRITNKTGPREKQEETNCGKSKLAIHIALDELVEATMNMTDFFGPPLLQNFSFMLFYWLLHFYCLIYFILETWQSAFIWNPALMIVKFLQCLGSVMIVRWVNLKPF